MTDVNISVEVMADAFQNQFDIALVLSADSDLVGPIETVRRLFPTKRMVVAFPPKRTSFAPAIPNLKLVEEKLGQFQPF